MVLVLLIHEHGVSISFFRELSFHWKVLWFPYLGLFLDILFYLSLLWGGMYPWPLSLYMYCSYKEKLAFFASWFCILPHNIMIICKTLSLDHFGPIALKGGFVSVALKSMSKLVVPPYSRKNSTLFYGNFSICVSVCILGRGLGK